jgi:hypothetical protein
LAAAMTPQPTTSAAALATRGAADSLGLDRLHGMAVTVLNKHLNDGGMCAACPGNTFPCALAVMAEHNAALR